jgi:hypothetical protein
VERSELEEHRQPTGLVVPGRLAVLPDDGREARPDRPWHHHREVIS